MNRAVKEKIKRAKRLERLQRRRSLSQQPSGTKAARERNDLLQCIAKAWEMLETTESVVNGVRKVKVEAAFDEDQANHVATARSLEADGTLWEKRCSKDVVAEEGIPTASATARAKWDRIRLTRPTAGGKRHRKTCASIYRCSVCKKTGHNRATCPEGPPAQDKVSDESDKTDDMSSDSEPDSEGTQEPITIEWDTDADIQDDDAFTPSGDSVSTATGRCSTPPAKRARRARRAND